MAGVICDDCDGRGEVLDAPVIGGGTYWTPCPTCNNERVRRDPAHLKGSDNMPDQQPGTTERTTERTTEKTTPGQPTPPPAEPAQPAQPAKEPTDTGKR